MRHPIALAPLLLAALAAAPATAPTSQPTTGPAAAVDWSEAAKHVGETVTVTGPVMGTHVAGKNVVLNVGKDYPAPDRFTILVPFDAAAGKSADDLFAGKTVTVTGPVKLYKKVPEIIAKTAADVTIAK